MRLMRLCARGIDLLSLSGAGIAGILMMVSATIVCYEVVARYVFNSPTIWTMEVAVYILVWFGFVSMAFVQKNERHIRIDLIIGKFSPRMRAYWDAFSMVFTLFFAFIFTYYGWGMFIHSVRMNEISPSMLGAPMWIPKLALVLGGIFLSLQLIKNIVEKLHAYFVEFAQERDIKWQPFVMSMVFIVIVAFALWLLTFRPIAGLLILLFTLLFGGIPIFASLGIIGCAGLVFSIGGLNELAAVSNIPFSSLNSFGLACLPLFILSGQILADSGVGEELYDLASKMVGNLPGGLGIATIASCVVFAAISISSVATALTIGLIALPSLVQHKYDKRMSYGVLTAGGTLGLMIPPSGAMIVYAVVTEESLGRLFFAGLIPGLMLAGMFSVYTVLFCWKTGRYEKGLTFSWKERFEALKKGIWGLLAPIIILVGMYSGVFTPTEAGAVVVAYAIIMSLIRKKLRVRDLYAVTARCTLGAGMILVIISTALILGNFMTLLQIPQAVVGAIGAADIPRWTVIALLMVMYLLLGMALEVVSALLITLPIVYPLITSLGFDGIWFAVLVTLNMEMGQLTPPVGLTLFAVQGLSGAKFMDVLRGVIPYFFIMGVGLIILALIPQLSTWLPNMLFN